MSEPVKKSYLLAVDDVQCAFLARVMPGISFIEVRGMDLADNKEMRALVTPIPQPEEPPKEEVKAEEPPKEDAKAE